MPQDTLQVTLGINQLKKLKVTIALFDLARERGWVKSQIEDMASRLVNNPRVRFEAFGDHELDTFATLDALAELEESGTADFLFRRMVEEPETDDMEALVPHTNLTKEQVASLSSRQKLELGNRIEDAKRKEKQ